MICTLKNCKGIGIEVKKAMQKANKRSKKYRNKLKMELNGCYRAKVNFKTFAIPF